MHPDRPHSSPTKTTDATTEPSGQSASRSDAPTAAHATGAPAQAPAPAKLELQLARRLLGAVGEPPLAIVFWNGERIGASSDESVAELHVRRRSAMWKMLLDPMYQFGECYSDGTLDIEGNLVELLRTVSRSLSSSASTAGWLEWMSRWMHRPRRNTLSGSRKNIDRHYDIGNDFYRLWLDEQLVYTCAYFAEPTFSLEQAQVAKMDHVCRKLRLQPGETVVEAGCGWGALALHMAREYGVTVRAYNISHEQIDYARRRACDEGLDNRVEFVEDDWRNISGRYDVFVSVGMLEHVGLTNYRLLSNVIDRSLKPCGRGLLHSIGRNLPMNSDPWIERRIFPGAYPPSLAQMVGIFEPNDFSVLDVENIRLHYSETLKHWLQRFEQSIDEVRAMFDDRFVRMWRLYLSGSIAAFDVGSMQLFQVVFARARNNQIPWTRADIYADGRSADRPVVFGGSSGA